MVLKAADIYRTKEGEYHHSLLAAVASIGVSMDQAWLVVLPKNDSIPAFVEQELASRVVQVTERDWFCARMEDAVLLHLKFN